MSSDRENTLVLIDSHALIHRAYHAFAHSNLSTSTGQPTHAVYGFAGLLLDVLLKFNPSHVIAIFDAPGPTIRHDQYGQYKANRSKPDDDLISQIPLIEELLQEFDIPILRVPGYEADDIIGTIDDRHSGQWARTIIVTGDRDLFQLVDEDTFVYLAGTSFSKSQLFDSEAVKQKMGIPPENIVDIKSLEGDSSDNIPGVKGIGKKGAVDLVQEFGDLDSIYKNIDKVPSRYQNKLIENQEMAQLSRKLATIICDVPLAFDFAEADYGTYDVAGLKEIFDRFEFRSLMPRLDKLLEKTAVKNGNNEQLSLLQDLGDEPESELPSWDGETLTGEHLYVIGEYNKEQDPLLWSVKHLSVKADSDVFSVNNSDFPDFIENCETQVIFTDDAKALMHCAKNQGVELKPKLYDLVISTYIISSGMIDQDLGAVLRYFQVSGGNTERNLNSLPEVVEKSKTMMDEQNKLRQLVETERRLMYVIVDMEREGIRLDKDKLLDYLGRLENGLASLETEIYKDAGMEFNIGSPKQVGEILFDKMGLPSGKKTKTGNYSTDERTLKEIIATDPIVQKILDWRELSKLLSTYIRPLPETVNEKTGRIHAMFNQIGALTGRFSSHNPNLQNIPLGEVAGVNVRDAFVPEEGSIFVAFDYSQQELRLLAELSKEENMQETFRRGEDIHVRTAMEIFDFKDASEVTKRYRKMAKTINFGIVYGISAFGLADRLKIDQGSARDFINKYFEEYPRVKEYFDTLVEKAKQAGYVETILGRRRDTSGLRSRNFHMRNATEREVMNFPLQGSAADVIKMAMVDVMLLEDYPAKLVLQVHDELIFEYENGHDLDSIKSDKKFLDFVRKVRQTMKGVLKLNVPFEVGVEVGDSWGSMQDMEVE